MFPLFHFEDKKPAQLPQRIREDFPAGIDAALDVIGAEALLNSLAAHRIMEAGIANRKIVVTV